MNKRLRSATLMLAALLLTTALTACGESEKTGGNPSGEGGTPPSPPAAQVTVKEQVLFEESGIKLTLTGFREGNYESEFTVLIENNSDVPIVVNAQDVSVNGYMIDPIFAAHVSAGKKSNDSIEFSKSDLEENSVKTIGIVELSFEILDEGSYDTLFETKTVVIETSAGVVVQQAPKTKSVVFDQNGIKISFVGFSNGRFGPNVKFLIENDSETQIAVQSTEESANGFMVDGILFCVVTPGKKANTELIFNSSSLTENSITQLESVELKFRITDMYTWKDIAETGVITLE